MAIFVLKLQDLRVHLRKIQVTGNISQWGDNRGIHVVSNSPPTFAAAAAAFIQSAPSSGRARRPRSGAWAEPAPHSQLRISLAAPGDKGSSGAGHRRAQRLPRAESGAPASRGCGAVRARRSLRSPPGSVRGAAQRQRAGARSRTASGDTSHEPCPARSRRHKSHEIASREAISAFPPAQPPLYVLHLLFTSLICKRLLS